MTKLLGIPRGRWLASRRPPAPFIVAAEDVAAFEVVAGDLLEELGYPVGVRT